MLLLCMLTPSIVVRRLNPFSFLMLFVPDFFFFFPRTVESCLFPRIVNFTVIFPLWIYFHLSYWALSVFLQSADICFSLLAPVFLSRTPIIWVLYFLDQSSDFLTFSFLFSVSFSFYSYGGQFLKLQFPTCLFGFLFCYCFKFPLFIYK